MAASDNQKWETLDTENSSSLSTSTKDKYGLGNIFITVSGLIGAGKSTLGK